jgi:hypothetical protein
MYGAFYLGGERNKTITGKTVSIYVSSHLLSPECMGIR